MTTKIEWVARPGTTPESWNVVTGCSPVSEGCVNCYSARLAATRLKHNPRYAGLAEVRDGHPVWTGEVRVHEDLLEKPLHWRKPRTVFVCSMSDLFHEDVPDDYILHVFDNMVNDYVCHHTFIVLTKRPYRMWQWFGKHRDYLPLPLENVWGMVTVENQERSRRIEWLLRCPFTVHGVSVEPMLEAVNLNPYLPILVETINGLREWNSSPMLDWVICGGESGPGARPMDLDWARDLRDQCQTAGVPFFLKQAHINGKLVKMPKLDGEEWRQWPNVTNSPKSSI